jgi:hypothetical protein
MVSRVGGRSFVCFLKLPAISNAEFRSSGARPFDDGAILTVAGAILTVAATGVMLGAITGVAAAEIVPPLGSHPLFMLLLVVGR